MENLENMKTKLFSKRLLHFDHTAHFRCPSVRSLCTLSWNTFQANHPAMISEKKQMLIETLWLLKIILKTLFDSFLPSLINR